MSFSTLGLDSSLLQNLARLGYAEPTPVQREAIPAVLAGGDLLMALGFCGAMRHQSLLVYNDEMQTAFRCWARTAHDLVGGRIGYATGAIRHLFHGRRRDRRYVERNNLLIHHRFDPAKHLQVDASGLYRWSASCPAAIRDGMLDYFYSRREDAE